MPVALETPQSLKVTFGSCLYLLDVSFVHASKDRKKFTYVVINNRHGDKEHRCSARRRAMGKEGPHRVCLVWSPGQTHTGAQGGLGSAHPVTGPTLTHTHAQTCTQTHRDTNPTFSQAPSREVKQYTMLAAHCMLLLWEKRGQNKLKEGCFLAVCQVVACV